jgi:hypothetical protein
MYQRGKNEKQDSICFGKKKIRATIDQAPSDLWSKHIEDVYLILIKLLTMVFLKIASFMFLFWQKAYPIHCFLARYPI